jgi:predicted O-linked N-acetylglucosamine transferase (SPINDLY family)
VSRQATVRATLADYGIGPGQIELLGGTPHQQHLAAFGEVDIALDPFPTNGGISTWEALWMGVPVVTKLGDSVSGRVSGSILCALKLKDWVADNDDAYVALAGLKASNIEALSGLRTELRSIIERSTAGNPLSYIRAVEKAYREIWRRWCVASCIP